MLAGDDLGSPTMLRLLSTWPTAEQLAATSREQLVAFARAGRHGWPERFADHVTNALAARHLPVRDYLVRAKAGGMPWPRCSCSRSTSSAAPGNAA